MAWYGIRVGGLVMAFCSLLLDSCPREEGSCMCLALELMDIWRKTSCPG